MTTQSLRRPSHTRSATILVASVALVAVSQLATFIGSQRPAPAAGDAPIAIVDARAQAANALAEIDRSIGVWTSNLALNDRDFLAARNIGLLYEARARISGDVTDYTRAEEAAARSLTLEPRQVDVQALHARILLATHDFSGALAAATTIDRSTPDEPAVLGIIGDASLELGDVERASTIFGRIERLAPGPAVTARLARIAFLQGDATGAVALAASAQADAETAGEIGPALSWYAYLAGTLSMSAGLPEDAARWFDRALADWPSSFLALAGRARAAAALGDHDAAIAGYQAAVDVAPQPDALTALGDLLALQGDTEAAERQYATVEAIARLQGEGELVYNRQLVLFNVNHDRHVAEALELAQAELVERQDAYGYDALAWALLANGRAEEADAAITTALAGGMRDAMLLFHAGEIALALGDEPRAQSLLQEALDIRGALDPLSAARAAESLESIR